MQIIIGDNIFHMRWLPPGKFWMGSPENEPERQENEFRHKVILTKGFWLAETACTQALWKAVMGYNPSHFKGDQLPVEKVSWNDCQVFINRLNCFVPGLNFRLPTEAEWEYACRAGTDTPFSFGKTITRDQVNCNWDFPCSANKEEEYRVNPIEVKALPANPWGFYQMHGNVWEWCQDWYGEYGEGTVTDPTGPENGERRVLRGGSWYSLIRSMRSAERGGIVPSSNYDNSTGFRLAAD